MNYLLSSRRLLLSLSITCTFLLLVLTPHFASAIGSDDEVTQEIANARLLGADFVVTSTKDSGPGTLRQAIADAKIADPDGSVITFAPNLNGKTIVISSGMLWVANGTPPLEISAAGLSRGITIDARRSSRVFFLSSTTHVRLDSLTITGGKTPDVGEGFGQGGRGGGLYISGNATMVDCDIIGNTTGKGGTDGGQGGFGGGFSATLFTPKVLTLIRCNVSGNTTGDAFTTWGGNGGGAYLTGSGRFRAIDCTFSDNATGTGPATASNNGTGSGGALYSESAMELEGCTVSSNRVDNFGQGGGIYTSVGVSLANCTVANNEGGQGGGLYTITSSTPTTIFHTTIAGNEAHIGGGLYNASGGTKLALENNLIANNTAATNPNIEGSFSSTGEENFINDTPLSALGDYGGPTDTMPPIPGLSDSSIFNHGAPAFVPATDQRGIERLPGREGSPGRQNDLGAVEVSTDGHLQPRLQIENGAAVFTVTGTNDDGPGSLRQAIADANAELNPQGSVIVCSPSLKGKTIGLTSGQLEILNTTNRVSLLGASLPRDSDDPVDLAGGVTISGNDSSRVLTTASGTDVLLRNLTLTEAHPETAVAGEGGAILSAGRLSICDSQVIGNRTRDVASGSSEAGAGMFLESGSSTLIYRSTISDNHCGSGTVATGPGGGIFNFGELVIVDSTVSDNRAGIGGFGGGMLAAGTRQEIHRSTISGNATRGNASIGAGPGGGIFTNGNSTPLLIQNTTIANNRAGLENGFGGDGGGILTGNKPVEMIHSTVVGNHAFRTGGGLAANASITVQNTIVSENSDVTGFPDTVGAVNSNGGNFTGPGAGLAPLGDYGGPTRTMPPLTGSPVLNTANPDVLDNDQRGALRNDPLGDDRGAVELTDDLLDVLTRVEQPFPLSLPSEEDVNAILPEAAGRFSGLLTDPETGKALGTMTVKMTSTGAVSIAISHNGLGVRSGFRTTLDSNGKTSGVLTVRGVNYDLSLDLVRTTGGANKFRFAGTFGRQDDVQHDVSLDRMGYHRRDNPAPMAGQYTSLLPATLDPEAPQGDGYGLVKIGTDGRVRFSGALGDGTRFTTAGFVSEDKEWRLFKDLYRTRPKGNIGGRVTFFDVSGASDFSGNLTWMKMADAREKFYPDGFTILDQGIVGSLYEAPYPGEAILAPIVVGERNNATLTFGKGNIDAPEMTYLDWDSRNRPVANDLDPGESLRISATTRSGLVRGSYRDKSSGQRFNFTGVAFQKQNVIAGLFPGDGETGFFAIEPAGEGDLRLQFLDGTELILPGYTLGDVGVDGVGSRYSYELVNVGTGNLTIQSVSYTGDVFYAATPAVTVLKPGEKTPLHVVIQPRTEGIHVTTLTVVSDVETIHMPFEVNGVAGTSVGQYNYVQNEWSGSRPSDQPPAFTPLIDGNFNASIHGGTYQGFITMASAGDPVVGFATVRANTRSNAFSAVLVMNGVRETVRGTFDVDGFFVGTTNKGTPVDLVKAEVQAGNGGVKLIGSANAEAYRFELLRNTFHKTANPANAYQGPFTLLLPSADRRADVLPSGDGYGAATIGLDGKTRAKLVLGDATKVSHSGFVSVDGEWVLYKDLYRTKPKGFIAGRLLFRDLPGISDFDGELQWVKHADRREKRFPRGFEIRQIVIGSVYTPPAPGEQAFSHAIQTEGAVNFLFNESDLLGLPDVLPADWQGNNRIFYTRIKRENLSARANPRNGLISGRYSDPLRRLTVPFGAAVFEKQNAPHGLVSGLFIAGNDTGTISAVIGEMAVYRLPVSGNTLAARINSNLQNTDAAAQTFIPRYTATVESIDARLFSGNGSVTATLVETIAGAPTGSILGTVVVNTTGASTPVNFDFSSQNIVLNGGTQYGLILTGPEGNANIWSGHSSTEASYPGGEAWRLPAGGSIWEPYYTENDGGDFFFEVHAQPAP